MKKIRYLILLVIGIFIPFSVLAEDTPGYINVSPSTITIEVGSSKSFNIEASNCVGDAIISSNNTAVATVSTRNWETGPQGVIEPKYSPITVNGLKEGTAIITIVIDGATFDGVNLEGQTRQVTVNVVSKSVTPQPNNNNNNSNKNNTPANNSQPNNNPTTNTNDTDNKSTNNKIKELSVDDYKVTKVDDNNYKLVVGNTVSSINVKATASDSKATIKGTGKHTLTIGDNNIEITVVSESGETNKINLKVTRKDANYIEDLEELLKKSDSPIVINIDENTKIESKYLDKIKNSKKQVIFSYVKDKKTLYSWSINGKDIDGTNDFITTVLFQSDNKDKIDELSNYADGLFISFKQTSKFVKNTKLKVYVGNKYQDGDLVNIYQYKNSKLIKLESKVKVKDGYIEFTIEDADDIFVSKSVISNENIVDTKTESDNNSYLPLAIVIYIILIIIIILLIIKRKKNKDEDIEENPTINNSINTNTSMNETTNANIDMNTNPTISTNMVPNQTTPIPETTNVVREEFINSSTDFIDNTPQVADYNDIKSEKPVYIYDTYNTTRNIIRDENTTTDNIR